MTNKPTLGYIGLGLMGKPMAINLLKAGYPVVIHNRSREVVQHLVKEGAEEAFSPKEVASRVDIIFTNLPDSPDVELVALGKDGILEGAKEGLIYVDHSTIKPSLARKKAAERFDIFGARRQVQFNPPANQPNSSEHYSGPIPRVTTIKIVVVPLIS